MRLEDEENRQTTNLSSPCCIVVDRWNDPCFVCAHSFCKFVWFVLCANLCCLMLSLCFPWLLCSGMLFYYLDLFGLDMSILSRQHISAFVFLGRSDAFGSGSGLCWRYCASAAFGTRPEEIYGRNRRNPTDLYRSYWQYCVSKSEHRKIWTSCATQGPSIVCFFCYSRNLCVWVGVSINFLVD